MKTWLERYEDNIDSGLDAKDEGNYKVAKRKLLKAAEALYLLAEGSDEGRLKEQRISQAEEVMELAEKLPKNENEPKKQSVDGGSTDGEPIGKISSESLDNAPSFDDIAGLEEVKEQINLRMIAPFTHPELAKKHGLRIGGGILMYGPPGTGKTLIARATAKELGAAFYAIKPSEIMSKWVGESENKIRELFAAARGNDRAVIFIDEIESLVPARGGNNSTVMQRVVPQFLAELEGFDTGDANPLLFMGATNEPWAIDLAMLRPGRFDVKVYIGLPDDEARKYMLSKGFENKALGSDVSIEYLVEETEGYSGADIRALIELASQEGFKTEVSSNSEIEYGRELITKCLSMVRPSVNDKILNKFEDWKSANA